MRAKLNPSMEKSSTSRLASEGEAGGTVVTVYSKSICVQISWHRVLANETSKVESNTVYSV